MTTEQITAIKCAYADLVGALQCFNQYETTTHDWESHLESIRDLEKQFPCIESIPVELERTGCN
jgi:hypothetical protein